MGNCMKKKYERFVGVYLGIFIIFVCETLFIVFLLKNKIILYEKFSGVVVKDDLVLFVLNDDELKFFHKNKNVYIDGVAENFRFNRVLKNVLKRDGISYHQVFIQFDLNSKVKENDVIYVTVAKENTSIFNIFRILKNIILVKFFKMTI